MCATIKAPEILKSPETRTDDRTEPLVPVVVHFTCDPFYADAMSSGERPTSWTLIQLTGAN